MMTPIFLILGITIIGVLVSIVWRFSSHRHELPCPAWLHTLVEMDNPFTKVHHAGEIIRLLDVQSGMKVLDAGCGPGRLVLPLAQIVGNQGEITAMDIQHEMLNRVGEKARAVNLNNIRFLNAGLGENNLESNYYDRALLVTVLGEIPNQAAALQEIYNALKPGGILSITEIIFDPHFQSRSKVLQLMLATGFQEKSSFGKKLAYTIHFVKPLAASQPCKSI